MLLNLAQSLREARIRARLRQADMAAQIGIGRATYQRMERGLDPGGAVGNWIRAWMIVGAMDRILAAAKPPMDLFEAYEIQQKLVGKPRRRIKKFERTP